MVGNKIRARKTWIWLDFVRSLLSAHSLRVRAYEMLFLISRIKLNNEHYFSASISCLCWTNTTWSRTTKNGRHKIKLHITSVVGFQMQFLCRFSVLCIFFGVFSLSPLNLCIHAIRWKCIVVDNDNSNDECDDVDNGKDDLSHRYRFFLNVHGLILWQLDN